MAPGVVLAMLRSTAQLGDVKPEQALLDLVYMLARTYETMDSNDWEVAATVGALLWGAEMKWFDREGGLEDLGAVCRTPPGRSDDDPG
jgi:hypothetical protein